jgi:hypothetical protein
MQQDAQIQYRSTFKFRRTRTEYTDLVSVYYINQNTEFCLKTIKFQCLKCNTGKDSFQTICVDSFIHSSMSLQPGPWPLLQFHNLFYTDGSTHWTSDQPVARPLPTHRTTQTQNKRAHRHPCLEWDSNPRSQRSSERRQFMS